MNAELYRERLERAHIVAQLVRSLDGLDDMLRAIDRADAVAPIVDPTAWIKGHERMDQDREVIAALSRAKHSLDRLPWPTESKS